jgi:hypothetical protein
MKRCILTGIRKAKQLFSECNRMLKCNIINSQKVYYLEVLKRPCEKGRSKGSKFFANNSWILHHNKAPAHTALSVMEFLANNKIPVLEHPYSPDLAPVTFSVAKDKKNTERKAF